MHPLLPTLLEEFHFRMNAFDGGTSRTIKFPNIPNKIMVAIGMRRVGKTYFLFQTIQKLLENTPITRILYLNFEDDRLQPLNQESLRNLIDGFYSLYPENHEKECYLFFDEIQNVTLWHTVIRRYFDTKKVKLFLTGSSAKLLSKEIATSLRGRSIAIEIWPYSFKEFLTAEKITIPIEEGRPIGKASLDKLTLNLLTYIEHGGFPETTGLEPQDRNRLLQDYVSTVIFRDIIERYHITNISLVRQLIKTLLKNVGTSQSMHKLFNDLRSQGFSSGKETIRDYLEYITDAYLAFRIPLYSESLRKVESNPRKTYAIDTGLVRAYSTGFLDNIGHLFENLVYLDLKRHGHEVHYYLTKTRKEIDFLSRDPLGKWHLYQVCWNLDNQQTRKREEEALEEAEIELGLKGSIITPETYFNLDFN